MSRSVQRAQVYRYAKSGRFAAVFSQSGFVGHTVLDLSGDLSSIQAVRSVKFLKRDSLSATEYQVEFRRTALSKEETRIVFEYTLIRVLSRRDRDIARWTSTTSLDELPVSKEPEATPEELAWAGERQGNLGWGVFLVLLSIGFIWLAEKDYGEGQIFWAVCAAGLLICAVRYPWRLSRKPDPIQLASLTDYKDRLRANAIRAVNIAQTEIEQALRHYSTWSTLSPKEFELAVSFRLKSEGYDVRVTKYSKDGGIDIEADRNGQSWMVQVKKFQTKVGVAVVREMIGVRQSHANKPRVMIYSLSGFTRGAQHLAQSEGVELRSVLEELVKV